MWLAMGLVFYILGAVVTYGTSFAYWQREWPAIAHMEINKDKVDSVSFAINWPVMYWVCYFCSERKFSKYGLKFK